MRKNLTNSVGASKSERIKALAIFGVLSLSMFGLAFMPLMK